LARDLLVKLQLLSISGFRDMNGPLSSAGAGSFTSSLKAISDSGKASVKLEKGLQDIEFSDLIDQENALPGLLEELSGLLPEQDFSPIEAFICGGNGLPQAADAGSDPERISAEPVLPFAAVLAVAGQQVAAAGIAGETPAPAGGPPLSAAAPPPTPNTAKSVTAELLTGMVAETPKTVPGSAAQLTEGYASRLPDMDIESIARIRASALQESASAVTINPMSALKAAEAAAAVRLHSPVPLTLDTPLAAKGWEQGVGDRVMWMLGNSVHGVSLRISPAHLGPIEIQLSLHQDQASVSFNAQHAVVREALEASIPRLREMFQENNLQLTHVDVGQQGGARQQAADGGARNGQEGAPRGIADQMGYDGVETEEQTVVRSRVDGLLNDYA